MLSRSIHCVSLATLVIDSCISSAVSVVMWFMRVVGRWHAGHQADRSYSRHQPNIALFKPRCIAGYREVNVYRPT